MKKLIYTSVLMTTLFALLMGGCGKKEEAVTEEPRDNVEEQVDKEPENLVIETPEVEEPETPAENMNLLTGEADLTEEAIGKRPVAVMLSNVQAAMPQCGSSEADIIIEMIVEGGLTRFLALYGDYTQVPDICSVRSCRYYFPAISEGFDAYYIHWGMDSTIKDYYNSLNLDSFNGMYNDGGIFDRNQERINSGYATEHTSMIHGGDAVVKAIEDAGMRTELAEDKTETRFTFSMEEQPLVPEGEACTDVLASFGAATAGFTYNSEENVYYKQFNGKDQVDGSTDIQLSFTNLFILETKVYSRGDSKGHVAVECYDVADQVGYYVSSGKVQEIRWSKADEKSELMFYDLEGNELVINVGKSYIAFNHPDQTTFK